MHNMTIGPFMKNEKQTCLRKTTVCFSCLRTRPTRAPCRQCNLIRSAVELLPVDILLVKWGERAF